MFNGGLEGRVIVLVRCAALVVLSMCCEAFAVEKVEGNGYSTCWCYIAMNEVVLMAKSGVLDWVEHSATNEKHNLLQCLFEFVHLRNEASIHNERTGW